VPKISIFDYSDKLLGILNEVRLIGRTVSTERIRSMVSYNSSLFFANGLEIDHTGSPSSP
jgi:hypothetical protein